MLTSRLPISRTSFLDSRFRLRNRTGRLLERGLSVSDSQLNPVAHVGRPGVSQARTVDPKQNRLQTA